MLFGSWARGEATGGFDVDVLVVVVDANRRLTRALYRRWDDEGGLGWSGHRVEPHFVHPADAKRTSGLWAEAAIDGIVLFERGVEISARLVHVRREIARGRLVRRTAHGQPYWTETEVA